MAHLGWRCANGTGIQSCWPSVPGDTAAHPTVLRTTPLQQGIVWPQRSVVLRLRIQRMRNTCRILADTDGGRARWQNTAAEAQGGCAGISGGHMELRGGPWLDGGGPQVQGEQFGCFPEGSGEPWKVFEWWNCSVKNGVSCHPHFASLLAHVHIHRNFHFPVFHPGPSILCFPPI